MTAADVSSNEPAPDPGLGSVDETPGLPVVGSNDDQSNIEVFTKKGVDSSVSFARTALDGRLLGIKENDGVWMRWGLSDIDASRASEKASYAALKTTAGSRKASAKNQSGLLTYEGLQPGVDVTYQLIGNSVKENLILANRTAAKSFTFSLAVDGLHPSLENNRLLSMAPAP